MRPNAIASFLTTLAAISRLEAKPLRPSVDHVVHEERNAQQGHWSKARRLHPSALLPVRIGLAQSNLHLAEEFIMDVSDPESPNYGKHWSPEKIAETFAPKQGSVDLVLSWLEREGVHPGRTKLADGRHWIAFNATAAEVERLLHTEYHYYKHSLHGHTHVACDKYHVPKHLAEHIDLVTPTVHFDARVGHDRTEKQEPLSEEQHAELKRRAAVQGPGLGAPETGLGPKKGAQIDNALMDLDQCSSMTTPDCLRALYALPRGRLASPNNTLGIVEYTPQAFLQTDLDMYFGSFDGALVGKSPLVQLIDSAVVQQTNKSFAFNAESALDLEFAMALIAPQQATVFQVGSLEQGASFNNFLDALDERFCTSASGATEAGVDRQYAAPVGCSSATPTNVISTSYAYNEVDLSPRYTMRQCNEYMKLGLRGITVIYSTGDFGVAGNSGACIDPATGALNSGADGLFNPAFPGSCPFVTAVGATQMVAGASVHAAEHACQTRITSGGGFSNVFGVPAYQKSAMAAYYRSFAPPYGADRFNNSRRVRGYPDVAANGANFVTAVDGSFQLSYGTSASAPTFAAIINLINEERIAARKRPVGFVNPALYANRQVMNDVLEGNNPGCGTQGFSAVPGWDPVTGLG